MTSLCLYTDGKVSYVSFMFCPKLLLKNGKTIMKAPIMESMNFFTENLQLTAVNFLKWEWNILETSNNNN